MAKTPLFRPTIDYPAGSPSKNLGHPQHNHFVNPHNLAERILPSIPIPFFVHDEVRTPSVIAKQPARWIGMVLTLPGRIIGGYRPSSNGSVGSIPVNTYQGNNNPGSTIHIGTRQLRHPLNGGY